MRRRVVGTGTYRNPWDQPFAATSYWNIGIGSSAIWSNPGDTDTQALTGAGGWTWNYGDQNSGWESPAWVGGASDPVMSYTAGATDPPCNNPSYATFHCPAIAFVQAGSGVGAFSDQWFTVLDSTNPKYAFTSCTPVNSFAGQGSSIFTVSGNTARASVYYAGIWDVTANGVTTPTFQSWSNAGNTGIRDFGLGGVLRTYDINRAKAGLPIQHGFRIALPHPIMKSPASYYTTNIPWPTWAEDYNHSDYTGSVVFGATLGIPSVSNGGPDFTKMGLSAPGLALCQAVQSYGVFIRDGSSNPSLPCEQGVDGSWVTQAVNDFNNHAIPYLRVMRNQSTNGASGTVNGGGTYPVTQIPDFYPALNIGNGRVGSY